MNRNPNYNSKRAVLRFKKKKIIDMHFPWLLIISNFCIKHLCLEPLWGSMTTITKWQEKKWMSQSKVMTLKKKMFAWEMCADAKLVVNEFNHETKFPELSKCPKKFYFTVYSEMCMQDSHSSMFLPILRPCPWSCHSWQVSRSGNDK